MNQLHIKSQNEFDEIPVDFHGRIYIEFGTTYNRAVINRVFKNATIVLCGNSSAELCGNSSAELWGNSSAELCGNSSAELWGNSSAVLWGNSSAVLCGNSSAVLWGNSSAVLCGNSSAELCGNSSAVLCGNSSAVLCGNSSAVLWGNSSAVLWGNSQVVDRSKSHKIIVSGNARIVYDPKTAREFVDFNGLDHDEKCGRFYKAVHRDESGYHSDWNLAFRYEIGATILEVCDPDTNLECSIGIHMSHKAWAVMFGSGWPDLAILELESDLDKVVVPVGGEKVRTSEARVIREVPLEECGLLGRMLASKRVRENVND